uniref:Receptor protein-tyrosine kinase n=1 Tax=Branchiostoma floridae TaxID=7739 RepID=C3YM56_BRAFL|eukprot:XP_002602638.1 hypothetical protein BRAFLDRAFT_81918 [Branchiostoma floridae]
MGKNLRHVLIFLLILWNESNVSETFCEDKRDFTSVPQNITYGNPLSLHNLIAKIPPHTLVKTWGVSKLDLFSNHITNIPAGTFAHVQLYNLQLLCLARNRITMIQNGTFAGLRRLRMLNMAHNRITRIEPGAFAELPQLWEIDLSFNQITTLQAGTFAAPPILGKLSMKNNKIAKIDPGVFAELPQLQVLILSSNQITMIQTSTFAELPELFTLDLDSNQITMIRTGTFADLPSLRWVYLKSNKITEIQPCAFVNVPKLREVKVDNNQLTMIQTGTFADLPSLRWVYLQSNKITEIQPCAFVNVPKLRKVRLDHNQLTLIRTGTFADLHSLEWLHLEVNKITEIQPCAFVNLPREVNVYVDDKQMLEGSICEGGTISTQSVDIQTSFQSSLVSTSSPFGSTLINAGPTARPEASTSATQSLIDPMQSANNSYNGTGTSRYHWYFKRDFGSAGNTSQARAITPSLLAITSDKPEIRSSHELSPNLPNAVLIASICGSIAGIILIGSIILTIWCKRRTSHPPLGLKNVSVMVSGQNDYENKDHDQTGQGQSQAITESNTNSAAAVMTSGHYHQYEDKDKQHSLTSQGQSKAITESNTNTTVSAVLSGHDHQYEDVDKQHNQIGQGQSQATTKLNTNTTAAVVSSGHDQQYEDMAPQHNQTGQDQSQAITKSNTNPKATVVASGHDHQYKNMDSQTGQDNPQAITNSFDARNLSYGSGPTASQLNSLYTNTTAVVEASSYDQAGQGQSQAVTESLDTGNMSYGTGPTASQLNSLYNVESQYQDSNIRTSSHSQTRQGQSQAIIESNPNTTAVVVTSGNDQTGQGQSQAITESNPSTTAAVVTSGHDQTGQGQSQAFTGSFDVRDVDSGAKMGIKSVRKPEPSLEGRWLWTVFLLVGLAQTVTGVVDVTIVSKYQFFDEPADTWLYCYYTGSLINHQNGYQFGVEVNTGSGTVFTSRRGTGEISGRYNVRIYGDAGDFRVGAFSCRVRTPDNSQTEKAITFKMKSQGEYTTCCRLYVHKRAMIHVFIYCWNALMSQQPSDRERRINIHTYILLPADVWPVTFTVTANTGDPVTLQMVQKSNRTGTLVWRKGGVGGTVLTGQNGLNFTMASVRASDEGIYECYYQGDTDRKQGIMRLIVRGCTENKWGPPSCTGDCPVCYNGGVCDDNSGECVCPPGFHGQNCESACANNQIGTSCTRECEGGDCTGQLLCVMDPYGCSCAPGLMGIECNTGCPDGMYGAGCTQTCHCASGGSVCDVMTGACSSGGCEAGWEGSNCQTECDDGYYGNDCGESCGNCVTGTVCDKTNGNCPGCEEPWVGDTCKMIPATVSEGPESVTLVVENDTTFSCTGRGVPGPSVVWYHGEEIITPGNGIRIDVTDGGLVGEQHVIHSTLTITSVRRQHNGKYVCISSNVAGHETSQEATLVVQERPDDVTVNVTAVNSTTLHVTWIVGETGNLDILDSQVRYKRSDTEDWGDWESTGVSGAKGDVYIHSLQLAVMYDVQVRVHNLLGWSDPGSGRMGTTDETDLVTVDDVVEFLKAKGFGQYAAAFKRHKIDGVAVMYLNDAVLAELVPEIGPRVKLQKALQELKDNQVCLILPHQAYLFSIHVIFFT